MREAGMTTPIVFVSGTWCDAKTFNWLRNILNVSLVFRKPINPQLFLQAIEDILPSDSSKNTSEAATREAPSTADYADLLEKGNFDESLAKLDELIATSTDDPAAVEELTQIRRKIRTQKAVHMARVQYVARMPAIWDDLMVKTTAAHSTVSNHALVIAALEAAHKLKGTAGSYGLSQISEIADQLETFLKYIDPSCSQEETSIFWSEIMHLLEEGANSVDALASLDIAQGRRKTVYIVAGSFSR
jgi:HPt (histidine-containing phosphotransfer) domain-containing protein